MRSNDLATSICQAALALPPQQREGFLDEECAGHAVLRREVDALLALHAAGRPVPGLEGADKAPEWAAGPHPPAPDAAHVRRVLLALASGAALVGIALSTLRTTPTPADWVQGLLRPQRVIERAYGELDSADVRLRAPQLSRARAREALAHAEQALALLRAVAWRPEGAAAVRAAQMRAREASAGLHAPPAGAAVVQPEAAGR